MVVDINIPDTPAASRTADGQDKSTVSKHAFHGRRNSSTTKGEIIQKAKFQQFGHICGRPCRLTVDSPVGY